MKQKSERTLRQEALDRFAEESASLFMDHLRHNREHNETGMSEHEIIRYSAANSWAQVVEDMQDDWLTYLYGTNRAF